MLLAYILPFNVDCFAWVENKEDGDINGMGDVLPAVNFPVGDAYSSGFWGVILRDIKFSIGPLWDGAKNGFRGECNITLPYDVHGLWVLCTSPFKEAGWIEIDGVRKYVPSWFYPPGEGSVPATKVAWSFPKYYERGREVPRKVFLYMILFPVVKKAGDRLSVKTDTRSVIFSISFRKFSRGDSPSSTPTSHSSASKNRYFKNH